MKRFTIGIFGAREDAEKAINHIHNELAIPNEDISYLYRNTEGQVREISADKIATATPVEGAGVGAVIGGTFGALAGIAAAVGVIPAIGPLFAAGPLAIALGITGAVGTTATGALTGAAAGGLIGGLINMGIGEEHAQRYADRVQAGDVLVAAYAPTETDVRTLFQQLGAIETETYALTV